MTVKHSTDRRLRSAAWPFWALRGATIGEVIVGQEAKSTTTLP